MFKLSIMSFEITFVVCGYHVYEDIWEVDISSELPFYLSQMIAKIVMLQPSFNCFKAVSTASLAGLVVAECGASDNIYYRPSGF